MSSGKHFAQKIQGLANNYQTRIHNLYFIAYPCGISFEIESMVVVTTAIILAMGEELPCKLKLSNLEDRFANVVVQSKIILGHVPKRYHDLSFIFARRRDNYL